MSEDKSSKAVTKFDGTNFQLWKFQMVSLLVAQDIHDVVTGTRPQPAAGTDASIVKKWTTANGRAMYLISTAIDYSQLPYLATCTTAKQMWDKLSSIHEQKSATNKLLLLQKFHQYKMAANDSVVTHVAKIQNMAQQLSDLDETQSDSAIMAKVLGSLPSKYNSLVTAWDSVAPYLQNIQNLQERLIKEERKLSEDDNSESAFAASTGKEKPARNSGNKGEQSQHGRSSRVECFYCKKSGHIIRYCRKRLRDEKNNAGDKDKGKPKTWAFVAESAASVDSAPNVKITKSENRVSRDATVGKLPTDGQVEFLLNKDTTDIWLTDSGASRHITFRRDWLTDFQPSNKETVSLGDNGTCTAEGTGTVLIEKLVDGKWEESEINNVLYVPSIRKNLFSVGVCTTKNYEVRFKGGNVSIWYKDKIVALGVKQGNDICRLFFRKAQGNEANLVESGIKAWHERLGHVNQRAIRQMIQKNMIQGVKLTDTKEFFCEACQFGKSDIKPFVEKEDRRPSKIGEFFHTDVCGPMKVESLSGAKYFLTFKDDASDFRAVFFIKHKSDVVDRFKEFERYVENKFEHPMKRLRSDNGKEYDNGELKKYLKTRGIQYEPSAPLYTSAKWQS